MKRVKGEGWKMSLGKLEGILLEGIFGTTNDDIAKHDVYRKLFNEKYLDRKLSDLAIEVF